MIGLLKIHLLQCFSWYRLFTFNVITEVSDLKSAISVHSVGCLLEEVVDC